MPAINAYTSTCTFEGGEGNTNPTVHNEYEYLNCMNSQVHSLLVANHDIK